VSPAVRAVLERAGWHEGRRVAIDGEEANLAKRGFSLSPAARALLEEFHGLSLSAPGPHGPRLVVFDPSYVLGWLVEEDLPFLDGLAGERPCPIAYSPSTYLYALASGEAITVSDLWIGYARLGSLSDALECLLGLGRPPGCEGENLAPERVPPEFR
jgi:hypothetical protein